MRLLPGLALVTVFGLSTSCSSGGAGPSASAASTAADAPAGPAVQLFALSDFHGWLFPRILPSTSRYYGGIAHIGAAMKAAEIDGSLPPVIVDNGDMWTGPIESTFLEGAPVVEAYNVLGVAAANVANHEYDFGVEALQQRASEARFPFLGANIVETATGKSPSFLKPWIIVKRGPVDVGIVGLSFKGTPETTMAKHVVGLEFHDYAETLRREIPAVRAAGADVVCVLLHDVPSVGHEVVRELGGELQIDVMIAGQDHRRAHEVVEGVPVVNPGPFGTSFASIVARLSPSLDAVSHVDVEIIEVSGSIESPPQPPMASLDAVAEAAREKTKSMTSERLGELGRPLPVGSFASSPLGQLIVDSWMSALADETDIAMLNHGAIRQALPAGEVTLGDITSVMPFENNIYLVELTGEQLRTQLTVDHPVVSGLTWTYREKDGAREVVTMLDARGQPLLDEKSYRVAILDFMYTGGDGYRFSELDATPLDTGLSWRDPVIRRFRLAETARRPLTPNPGGRARKVP